MLSQTNPADGGGPSETPTFHLQNAHGTSTSDFKMGPLDAIIQLLLFVCFGVYIVMGLSFLVMGIVYVNDEGAVGSTGIYLILLGLLMLIIGGIAVFANLKKIWLILFVIELVNVALFLVRRLPCNCPTPVAPPGQLRSATDFCPHRWLTAPC